MKDFGRWMADYNNSIDDESVIKEEQPKVSTPKTDYQIRAEFATHILGKKPETTEEVVNWTNVFSTTIDEDDGVINNTKAILGIDLCRDYINNEGDDEDVAWWEDFIEKIAKGVLTGSPSLNNASSLSFDSGICFPGITVNPIKNSSGKIIRGGHGVPTLGDDDDIT